MTIGAAWISKSTEGEELWIASDSRLTGDGNVLSLASVMGSGTNSVITVTEGGV